MHSSLAHDPFAGTPLYRLKRQNSLSTIASSAERWRLVQLWTRTLGERNTWPGAPIEVDVMDRLDLNDLRLLSYVVDCGGFSAASKALSIPTSTISQRIASLERAAGIGLLRRTTRHISLTDAGKLMVPHARAIEERARDVLQTLQGLNGEVCGTIRVASSNEIVQFVLAPILPKFFQCHPKVTVHIDATNRRVDLVGEGYDLEIRVHTSSLDDSSLVQRVVARTPWRLAAAPAYLERHAAPGDPSSLATSEVLYFGDHNKPYFWRLQRDKRSTKVELRPSICCNDMVALRIAAIRGGGIVGLPAFMIDTALKQRELIPVLPEWTLAGSCISIITLPKRQSSRLIKCFADFVATELPAMTNPV
jgi:DNA-binding transcriptional LysR family regulator